MRIELQHVVKTFGPSVALDDIDLVVEPGERVALIGPNGSGKSTLIRVLMGMLRADGEVRVGSWSPFTQREALAEHVAYVPQIAPQVAVPVGQLVDTVSHLRGVAPEQVVDICLALDFDAASHAHKPFRDLSGGMKQKLLIALALAAQPRLLVMDEPSASLDADARRQFFELCADLDPQTTLVLCSHRLEEVRHLIDRIVALEDGHLVSDGPVEDIVSTMGRAAIEVRASREATDVAPELESWLVDHGFRELAGGRWVAFLPWKDKLSTVETLIGRWGSSLDDIVVNDVRELQVEPRAAATSAPAIHGADQ